MWSWLYILLIALAAISALILLATFFFIPEDKEDIPDGNGSDRPSAPAAAEATPPDTPKAEQPEHDSTPAAADEHKDDEPVPAEVLPIVNIREADAQVAAKLDDVAEKYNCVGASLSVFSPDKGYATYQYGYEDISASRLVAPDTKFRVASLSKIAVAIIAMSLVERGLMDLDEDISTYLGYEVINPSHPDISITSRMLIQHTSSVIDTQEYVSGLIAFDLDTIKEFLGKSSSYNDAAPGEVHAYSNVGYVVLATICEVVSGELFDTLAGDVLFKPLDIDAAFVSTNLNSKKVAAQYGANHSVRRSVQDQLEESADKTDSHISTVPGNLMITTLDYTKILILLVNGGIYDGIRVLSEESVQEMHNANVLSDYDYMQGLSVRELPGGFMGDSVYYHTGSAYGTFAQFFYSPETGRIVVVVTTGSNTGREDDQTVIVCTQMSELVWKW